jgi:hypothetical protein
MITVEAARLRAEKLDFQQDYANDIAGYMKLITDDAALLAAAKSCTNTAGKFCGAVRQRLKIADPTVN